MKQSLNVQLGQQLTMTPQLQQAIRLLQLSTLDLRQEIQEALDTNPMLEAEESEPEYLEDLSAADEDFPDPDARELEDLPGDDDLPVDTDWDQLYSDSSSAASPSSAASEDFDFDRINAEEQSLVDHLLWQLNLTRFSVLDRAIAVTIIDAVDDNGYLQSSLEDIADATRQSLESCPDNFPEAEDVLSVLKRVQQFDPPGVASRDLSECLQIQLQLLPHDTPWKETALSLLQTHQSLLENRDIAALRRKMGLSEDELTEVLKLVRSLNISPGETIREQKVDYIVPDVVLVRQKDRWVVELNPDALPKVRINQQYAAMSRTVKNEKDSNYLKNNLAEAKWFLKSLASRNETLLKVSSKIVEFQQDFFLYGEEAMKPLVLSDIAEAVELHESTVSRVTNQKYMMTPQGVFELKYFFSSHVGTDAGGECSSTAIRAIIKKLVAAENPRKPLSDNKLAALLQEQGIKVARRTVAKYREAMKIASSSERKRLM